MPKKLLNDSSSEKPVNALNEVVKGNPNVAKKLMTKKKKGC